MCFIGRDAHLIRLLIAPNPSLLAAHIYILHPRLLVFISPLQVASHPSCGSDASQCGGGGGGLCRRRSREWRFKWRCRNQTHIPWPLEVTHPFETRAWLPTAVRVCQGEKHWRPAWTSPKSQTFSASYHPRPISPGPNTPQVRGTREQQYSSLKWPPQMPCTL